MNEFYSSASCKESNRFSSVSSIVFCAYAPYFKNVTTPNRNYPSSVSDISDQYVIVMRFQSKTHIQLPLRLDHVGSWVEIPPGTRIFSEFLVDTL